MEAGVGGGTVALPAGTFKLTIPPAAPRSGSSSWPTSRTPPRRDLDISTRIEISGEGPGKTVIDGLGAVRIFDVHAAGRQPPAALLRSA